VTSYDTCGMSLCLIYAIRCEYHMFFVTYIVISAVLVIVVNVLDVY